MHRVLKALNKRPSTHSGRLVEKIFKIDLIKILFLVVNEKGM